MEGLSLPNAPSFQAHEDSEKLREIVLPMEQEIAELKLKLLRAEELIQEIQVRGSQRCRGKEGRPGHRPPASSLQFPLETAKTARLPAWLHGVASTIKESLTPTGTLGGAKWRRRPSC